MAAPRRLRGTIGVAGYRSSRECRKQMTKTMAENAGRRCASTV